MRVQHLFPQTIEHGSVHIHTKAIDAMESCQDFLCARDFGYPPMHEGREVTILHIDNELWMSDSNMEIVSNQRFARKARGHVFVAGLGLGLVVQMLMQNYNIESITVMEVNQDVIDVVKPTLHPDVVVLKGDVWEPSEVLEAQRQFDSLYFDVWSASGGDNHDEFKELRALYRPYRAKGSYATYWGEEWRNI